MGKTNQSTSKMNASGSLFPFLQDVGSSQRSLSSQQVSREKINDDQVRRLGEGRHYVRVPPYSFSSNPISQHKATEHPVNAPTPLPSDIPKTSKVSASDPKADLLPCSIAQPLQASVPQQQQQEINNEVSSDLSFDSSEQGSRWKTISAS
jgi:hypothetical protein